MRLIFYKSFGLKDAFAPKYLFLHKNFFQTGRCKIPWVRRTHVGGMSILSFSKVILCTFPRKIATFKLLSNICRSSIKPCLNEPTSVVGWTFSAEHWFLHTWKGNVYDSHPWLLEGSLYSPKTPLDIQTRLAPYSQASIHLRKLSSWKRHHVLGGWFCVNHNSR